VSARSKVLWLDVFLPCLIVIGQATTIPTSAEGLSVPSGFLLLRGAVGVAHYRSAGSGSSNLGTTVGISARPDRQFRGVSNVLPPGVACFAVTTITSPPAGGAASVSTVQNCPGGFTSGSTVSIFASANSGYQFVSWSATNCTLADGTSPATSCTLTDTGDAVVTANFATVAPACYTLTASVNPGAGGTTTINTAQNCTGGYTSGTPVSIAASANSAYQFSIWTSTNCTLANANFAATTCTMTGGGNSTVTANFTATQAACSYTIAPTSGNGVGSGGNGAITVTGTPSGCTGIWSAWSNVAWLTLTGISGGSGAGPFPVPYSYTVNPSTSSTRQGSVSFSGSFPAGGTFTLTQNPASQPGGVASHPFIDVTGATAQMHDLGVGPDGSVYVLFPTGGGTAMAVVKSTDGGASWSSPVSVPNSPFSNSDYSMAVDSGGTVHVVWWLSSSNGTETYYSQSSDGAASFSSPIRVRTGNSYSGYQTNNAIWPVVAADGVGNVYVAYGAFTKDAAGSFVGYNVWVSQSTDGGNSFQPEFPINTISSAQKRPVRIRATASNFYVLYLDETNYDTYFYRRNAGAASANTGRLNANTGSVQGFGDFVVAPNEMTFYAAYSDTTGDYEGNITFCKSTDGGITWPACTRVNDSAYRYQYSPAVGLDSLGGLHVAWTDFRSNHRFQTYYSYSADSGATFSANVNVSAPLTENNFEQPHLVIDNANSALYISATRDYSQVMLARRSSSGSNASPAAPTGVTAAAVTSTRVDVAWTAPAEATSYQIDRKAAGGVFSQIGTSMTNSFSDTAATADSAYLYRVRAVNGSGPSPSSAADLATTVVFDDSPLNPGIFVKAVHLSQLRTAVNAVRLLAGLPAASFTDAATAGTPIQAMHVTELRSALDAALGTLGLSTSGYTDAPLSGVDIKAVHFQELRNRVQ
jgi:Divergent InlB B-repeat domain